jgi:HK97 family phage portal protein
MKTGVAGFRERWSTGLKAFRMAWTGTGGGSERWPALTWGTLPGSRLDYTELAGDVTLNSAVAICLGWIADNIAEPELRVYRGMRDGTPDPIPDHPLARLLETPNPYYDGDTLWAATAISYSAHGNAYWLKVRDQASRLAELWYVPHWQLRPCWPEDGSEFISHYVYRVNGRDIELSPRDVVHFRYGLDPANQRLGLSRLRPVLREIVTDNEASVFMAALLRNMGVPGVLITPAPGTTGIFAGDVEALKEQFRTLFRGELRGEPMVPAMPVRVEKVGLTPEELVLEKVRWTPEARICGALRLPPLVVGLNVGDLTKTYANYGQARKAAYEDCLMPLGRRLARAVRRQVLPELSERWREERVGWDYSQVAALREDLTAVYQRNSVGVRGGWMRVNEARSKAGLPHDPAGDVYLRSERVEP